MLNYFEIGQRIRKLRRERNLSQEQLAEKVWISTTHMSHIETGNTKLSLQVLVDLAAALGVSTDEILSGTAARGKIRVESDIAAVLDSCTDWQAAFIADLVKSTKAAFDLYLRE